MMLSVYTSSQRHDNTDDPELSVGIMLLSKYSSIQPQHRDRQLQCKD